jgi:hypothetical protein
MEDSSGNRTFDVAKSANFVYNNHNMGRCYHMDRACGAGMDVFRGELAKTGANAAPEN